MRLDLTRAEVGLYKTCGTVRTSPAQRKHFVNESNLFEVKRICDNQRDIRTINVSETKQGEAETQLSVDGWFFSFIRTKWMRTTREMQCCYKTWRL